MYKVKNLATNEVEIWTMEQILDEINRDHSTEYTNYREYNWEEGWNEWVEGKGYYELVKSNEEENIIKKDSLVTKEELQKAANWYKYQVKLESETNENNLDLIIGDGYRIQVSDNEILLRAELWDEIKNN